MVRPVEEGLPRAVPVNAPSGVIGEAGLRVLVEGSVVQVPAQGISKATLGLYDACLAADPSLEITVVHRAPLRCRVDARVKTEQIAVAVRDDYWRELALPYACRLRRPDVVHFPWNGRVPVLLPREAVVVITVHDVLPLDMPGSFGDARGERLYRERLQRDLLRADVVMTVSEHSKRRIVETFSTRAEPLVVPLAVTWPADGTAPRRAAELHLPERYFFYCGGYHPRKRLDLLIRVVAELRRAGRLRIPLVVAGGVPVVGELRGPLLEGIRSGALRVLPHLDEAVLAEVYRNALALVYPSRHEGFGLPPLEAMSVGCPVVACRSTSIPEVCGDAALYLEPGADGPFELAEALLLLAEAPARRRELCALGRAQAARFSWARSAELFLGALRAEVARRVRAGGSR